MHGNDIHEALYQNHEIHNPWDRGTGPMGRVKMAT